MSGARTRYAGVKMTSAMKNREHAEAAAAEWIARRERDDWSDANEAELNAWISASMDNHVAWLRLHAAWEQTQRLKSLLTTTAPGSIPRPEEICLPFFDAVPGQAPADTDVGAVAAPPAGSKRRHASRYLALAASLLIAIGSAVSWQLLRTPGYHTGVGALQSVPLPDGSRVTLNTNTSLRVEDVPTERRVNLERGEAFFEVAKDPKRPFVVNAGSRRVVAVGTQFSVRREGDEVRVLVTKGTVRLESAEGAVSVEPGSATPESPQSPKSGPSRPGEMLLRAGTIARADGDAILVREKPVAEVEQLLSWRSGYLVFDKTPLADAVAEFNRYNTRQVVIEDPRVAAVPVGGSFRATNVDAFVRLIAGDLSITATDEGNRIVLSTMAPP